MEVLMVIGLIALLYAGYSLLGRGTAGLINNTLNRTNHKMGQHLTRHAVVFASERDPWDLLEAVRRGVPVRERTNITDVDVVVDNVTSDGFEVVIGNRWNTNAVCLVALCSRLPGNRTGVVFTVPNWLESDGSVTRPKRLQTVRDAFEAACRRFDPQGRITEVPVDRTPPLIPPERAATATVDADDPPSTDDERDERWGNPTGDDTVEGPPILESGTTPASPTTGWYEDPAGTGDLRWWDGTTWTSKTRRNPTSDRIQDG